MYKKLLFFSLITFLCVNPLMASNLNEELQNFLIGREAGIKERLLKDNIPLDIAVEGKEKPNRFNLPRPTALSFANFLFSKRKTFDKTVEFCQVFITADPNDAQIYYIQGLALEASGKIDEAIESYNKSLAISTLPIPNFKLWGIYFFDKNNNKLANTHLKKFTDILSEDKINSPQITEDLIKELFNVGDYFLNVSFDFNKATKYFKMVLQLNPENEQAKLNLDIIKLKKSILVKDKALFDEAVTGLKNTELNAKDLKIAHMANKLLNEQCKNLEKQIFGLPANNPTNTP